MAQSPHIRLLPLTTLALAASLVAGACGGEKIQSLTDAQRNWARPIKTSPNSKS
jgi:hypothetical protein